MIRTMAIGNIIFVSRNAGTIVVQSDAGFTVVELLGNEGQLEKGDEVLGDWSACGREPICRDNQSFDAYFQGCWGNANAAIQIARQTGGG
jgi:hypothetical protein